MLCCDSDNYPHTYTKDKAIILPPPFSPSLSSLSLSLSLSHCSTLVHFPLRWVHLGRRIWERQSNSSWPALTLRSVHQPTVNAQMREVNVLTFSTMIFGSTYIHNTSIHKQSAIHCATYRYDSYNCQHVKVLSALN